MLLYLALGTVGVIAVVIALSPLAQQRSSAIRLALTGIAATVMAVVLPSVTHFKSRRDERRQLDSAVAWLTRPVYGYATQLNLSPQHASRLLYPVPQPLRDSVFIQSVRVERDGVVRLVLKNGSARTILIQDLTLFFVTGASDVVGDARCSPQDSPPLGSPPCFFDPISLAPGYVSDISFAYPSFPSVARRDTVLARIGYQSR